MSDTDIRHWVEMDRALAVLAWCIIMAIFTISTVRFVWVSIRDARRAKRKWLEAIR